MKQIININETFIRNAIINSSKRIDFRPLRDSRELNIIFGQEFGTCFVRLGQTLIFSSTSAEITEPKISRPNQGVIELSLDLCSASERWLDSYQRQLPEEGIQCLRLLERTIKDSDCVDTESLCLITSEKVWKIKCHIVCLNFDGNLCEATSIAAIASLSHFKRPDISVSSDGVINVYPFEERNPLGLTFLHYPFCMSFAFFKDNQSGLHMICDPLEEEELSADGSLIMSANTYREILGIHCSGRSVVDRNRIISCSNIAIERVKQITDLLKSSLQTDREKRNKKENMSFAQAIQIGLISNIQKPNTSLLDMITVNKVEEEERMEESEEKSFTDNVYLYGRGVGTIGEGGQSKWKFVETIESDEDSVNEMDFEKNTRKIKTLKLNQSDEEEDEVIILNPNDFKSKP